MLVSVLLILGVASMRYRRSAPQHVKDARLSIEYHTSEDDFDELLDEVREYMDEENEREARILKERHRIATRQRKSRHKNSRERGRRDEISRDDTNLRAEHITDLTAEPNTNIDRTADTNINNEITATDSLMPEASVMLQRTDDSPQISSDTNTNKRVHSESLADGSTIPEQARKVQKIRDSSRRPRQGDYDTISQEIIAYTLRVYSGYLCTKDAYPDKLTELAWAKEGWTEACNALQVQVEAREEIYKMVVSHPHRCMSWLT